MPFCANCGSDVQGKFCAKCGTPVVAPAGGAPPPAGGAAYSAPPPPAAPAQAAGLEENVACALCYALGVLTGILFLVLEPYNRNRTIRFHAFQSIFTFVGLFVLWIAIGIFGQLPFIGWTMYVVLMPILGLAVFVLWLLLMYKAYNREKLVLPVIGPLAEKQA